MDPLVMGKLIDNKVNSEDVTSLIFYWANKGYIKIDMEKEDDPILIRITQRLPEGTPSHQTIMYEALFKNGDMVKISQLENTFYPTVDAVKKEVNANYKGLYTSKSIFFSILFAVLGAALIILPPMILANTTISGKLFYYPVLIMIVPVFLVYALTESLWYARLKLSTKKKALLFLGIVLLAAVITTLYVLILPGVIMETIPKILTCVLGYVIIILSVSLINRNKEYIKRLNDIVGFRNFILYTEKDRLEAMLKDDPQFYYHILPYAQILGVTDIWQDKFKTLTIQQPAWTTNPAATYFEVAIITRTIMLTNIKMAARMIARPSSSGSSGGGHGRFGGGSFGGHSGGGHGGGGGRII
jgi:uncharacterized membrane protein YgcG